MYPVKEENRRKRVNDMKKKKIVILILAIFMVFTATLGNSYIYAGGTDVKETQGKEREQIQEETGTETPKETEGSAKETEKSKEGSSTTPLLEEEKSKEVIEASKETETKQAEADTKIEKEAEEKPAVLSANDVMPVAFTPNAGPYQITSESGGGWNYNETAVSPSLQITSAGSYTITSGGNEATRNIFLFDIKGGVVNLTIKDLNMKAQISANSCSNLEVNLTIEGDNTITGNCGINTYNMSSLTIQGTGTLRATGTSGPGIGQNSNYSYATACPITINSGTIIAETDDYDSAAIGSSKNESVSSITINGGNVTATVLRGSGTGAGIGSGGAGSTNIKTDNITINGGNVTATAIKGAGIGGGRSNGTSATNVVENITINGGNVTATSRYGASIGSGGEYVGGNVKNITITGGTVTASSTDAPSDIGNGSGAADYAEAVWIQGGSVYTSKAIKPDPYYSNSYRKKVYVGELINQAGVTNVKVDGVDYKIDGNHKDNDNFYLYMEENRDHYITTEDASGNGHLYKATWNSTPKTFTITDADNEYAGDFRVVGGTKGTDWIYYDTTHINPDADRFLIIQEPGTYDIYQLVDETNAMLAVATGESTGVVTLTIHDLNIKNIGMMVEGDLKLILDGDNRFDGTASSVAEASVGLQVSSASTLEISGTGSLYCKADADAGIGGTLGDDDPGHGAITIKSGNIIAESNTGAGIGGATGDNGENITITGGTVTATSVSGDGIGSGASSTTASKNIVIDGGSVKASGAKAISITPKNKAGSDVAMFQLKNQSAVNTIKIDNTSYTLNGFHPSDTSYYLYMTKADHTITRGSNTYNVLWDATNSIFKLKAPTPSAPTTAVTVNSITVTAPSNTSTYGAAKYSLDKKTWQTSNVFSNLKAGTNYTIYVKYSGSGDYGESDAASKTVKTLDASYTVTVPQTMTAGGTSQNIAVGTSFEVGYGGQINVKVKSGMDSAGIMPLTRTTGSTTTSISTQFKVGGSNFTNTSINVATFKNKTDSAAISFGAPTYSSGTIPAGDYSGTVTFEISYTQ